MSLAPDQKQRLATFQGPDLRRNDGCDPTKVFPLPACFTAAPEAVFDTMHDGIIELICHDDALNWQKFYNMAYVNLGLMAAYGLALDKNIIFSLLLCIFGILSGWGFNLTLKEGMRCITAHRCKLDILESAFCVNEEKRFVFAGNVPNRREALKYGPYVCIAFWVILFIVTLLSLKTVLPVRAPTSPLTSQPAADQLNH
jgi:hypothetical protein